MRTVRRKAREVADRERLLLELALRIVRDEGFHALTLGRLADRAEYSKGTVYNHFTSREDLLIELSAESVRRQLRAFRAVDDLPWDDVRKLYAIAVAYVRFAEQSPTLFECGALGRSEYTAALASAYRLERRDLLEAELALLVTGIGGRIVAEGRYGGDDVTPAVSVDAVRSCLLGYALSRLPSSCFPWTDRPDGRTDLRVLSRIVHGLGWPALELTELERVDVTIRELLRTAESR